MRSSSDQPTVASAPLLSALTEDEVDTVGRLSAKAVASFNEQYDRLPDKAELARIFTLITRAVLAPEATSYALH